ncbi:hypothetical protein PUNSTDRAFT_55702 [Punctularia strigosozonata HHB-11173 SS5]|uniref:SMODS and SLOG-associating 2TM effector domain-containing protein n=1 Tax=Punctularia strigosozonata (strain HHB-11173) TaxID=741275 RepID=R7S2M2_PUNST|nr:uncharacterized protein PUNSTDRAFT_55702 [Punctularia strigosozonata HHB-11173 SS5]EIN04099.1 hypothetical protein PUNSTDRAFT_55702 [Punctularia strigosozonata HHB-11173 SS5]
MTGTTTKSLTIAQRLEPTLEFAQRERAKYARKARLTGMALNVAIGSQVVLGALTTGLAAATTGRTTSVVVSVFGGASTCVATYLARVRGSGEPETSKQRVRDLDHFVREVQALMLDKGYILSRVDDHGEHIRDHYDDVIDDLRRRFEELIGNNIDNGTPEKSRMPMKTSV